MSLLNIITTTKLLGYPARSYYEISQLFLVDPFLFGFED